MPSTAFATNTQVIEEWVKTLPGIDTSKVGPTLPSNLETWAESGFWQITTVGGSPDPDLGTKSPVTEISCWAATKDAEFPPFNRAEQMAMAIRNSAVNARSQFLTVNTLPVFLLGVSVVTEPIRVPDVRTGYARVMLQVQSRWDES